MASGADGKVLLLGEGPVDFVLEKRREFAPERLAVRREGIAWTRQVVGDDLLDAAGPRGEDEDAIGERDRLVDMVGNEQEGLPLNGELTRLGARFLRATQTAPFYRLYALAGGPPARPGLVRSPDGARIDLETWALPRSRFGDFIEGVPQPLGIGTVTLATDETVKGFICEPAGLDGARDVTEYGGWRNYLAARAA